MTVGITAIVTGHSRGFGEGIAAALLQRGIPVLGISRQGNSHLAAAYPNLLREERLDLSDMEATANWLNGNALTESVGQGSALLVNNAGLLKPIGPMQDQTPGDVWRSVSVNVGAALALSAAFVRATEHCRERRILHVSSGAGRKAYAGWSVYCATKAALDHHARAVDLDRTPRLRMCSLAPGVIDTEMQAEIRSTTPERFPEKERFVAMKRDGTLRDPARVGEMAVELLLSDSFGSEVIAELPR